MGGGGVEGPFWGFFEAEVEVKKIFIMEWGWHGSRGRTGKQ